MGLHKNLTLSDVHSVIALSYANASARTGATGLLSTDLGKLALQVDTNSVWLLTGIGPVTWSELTSTTGPTGTAGGSLAGSYPNPTIAASAIGSTEIAAAIKDAAAGTASLRTLGTSGVQAAAGNDSRLSDSRAPTGAAGGSLAGTFPNPTIAAGAIGTTELGALAVTDAKVATANKDGVAATPSLRTLGTGAQQAAAGNDSRLSDSRTPTGTAGGSLAGTYPNPTIAAGAITGTEIAASIKDAVAGTASLRTLGTSSVQAAAGNDSRLSDSRAPSGTAGGSLAGSYPNPTVAAGAITGTEIASSIKDAAAATASLRTLGTSSVQATAGNDSRLSDSRAPTGAAGGSLAGTFPNPTIAAGAIGGTEIAAAIKDAAAATASLRTLGTSSVQAAAGNDSRLSDSRTPTGTAGGDLSGTYPNPTVATLAITDAKVAAANKDGTAATASMRTLGTGSTQACAGNDSRLSDSRAPNGTAGGDLTGTFPNPTVGTNKIQNTQFRQGAARSLVGVTGNATANVADIAGAGAGTYARDSGTVVAFSAIQAADLPAASGAAQGALAASDFTKLSNLLLWRSEIPAYASDIPNNSDWAVNAFAPLQSDAAKAGLTVAGFDDTIEQGRGFELYVPAGATQMVVTFVARAATAPGAARTAGPKLYKRLVAAAAGTSAVAAWDSVVMTDFAIPTNTNWQVFQRTVLFSAFTSAMAAGNAYQFEFTRRAPAGGTNLTGNLNLKMIIVEFS